MHTELNQQSSIAKRLGATAANAVVSGVKKLFRLLAWVPLGILFYPFRNLRIVKQVPNLLSISRIVLSAPIAVRYFFMPIWHGDTQSIRTGAIMVGVLAWTDAVDGPLSDILDAGSDLGKLLDPAGDKMFAFVMLLGYSVLVGHEMDWLLTLPCLAVTGWVFWVELKLILVARQTAKRVLALRDQGQDPNLVGANIYGKVKFNLQVLAVFTGWWALVNYPESPAGPAWMITILLLARFFADKSLGQHRKDLDELYK